MYVDPPERRKGWGTRLTILILLTLPTPRTGCMAGALRRTIPGRRRILVHARRSSRTRRLLPARRDSPSRRRLRNGIWHVHQPDLHGVQRSHHDGVWDVDPTIRGQHISAGIDRRDRGMHIRRTGVTDVLNAASDGAGHGDYADVDDQRRSRAAFPKLDDRRGSGWSAAGANTQCNDDEESCRHRRN